ncbi:hypothetical protein SARC_05448 [Sphaeroforma arctica JP610]|uniref:RGS domain-containing protein n=1 Tax=Sphaeroforma arctica JP610 TaxID=667725 RepID=A0A0L0G0B4_9EUKA|nr:hypothetical protein SARC_05448 [Sphaeroforma arctica JP610]KNC82276.1 hypothetical protein SARC_05448 [Sphaeroforma arctica JP610]|eukprot:XP_014156178.1 hypothetical protein SARC_05448 [Sphaeroforma arctica JP610]
MMIIQVVILVISMCKVRFESKSLAFYRFSTSVVQCFHNKLGISENTLISQAYDLIDPRGRRGRLDLLLQDKELYPVLLAMAGRRHMDENFRFMQDVRRLKRMLRTEANTLTVQERNNDSENISRLTLQILDNYIMQGAAHPVNLPSRILKPLREMRESTPVESSMSLHQVEVDIYQLLWMAYAETVMLVHESNVLDMFSKNPTVCDILKSRVDRLTTLCGTDARPAKPPQTTNLLHIEERCSSNSVRDEA